MMVCFWCYYHGSILDINCKWERIMSWTFHSISDLWKPESEQGHPPKWSVTRQTENVGVHGSSPSQSHTNIPLFMPRIRTSHSHYPKQKRNASHLGLFWQVYDQCFINHHWITQKKMVKSKGFRGFYVQCIDGIFHVRWNHGVFIGIMTNQYSRRIIGIIGIFQKITYNWFNVI
jgi:hypothetical protein